MNFVEQLSAVVLLVDFFLGVIFGVVGGAVHGSRREDREYTVLRAASDPLSAGARVLYGLYTRDDDGYMQSLLPGGSQVPGDDHRDDASGAQGQDPER